MGDGKRVKMNDRLSELPEGIISNILSRLNTQEAVRTSVLAKQWRYYWTNVHSLNFCNSYRQVLDKFLADVLCRRQHCRLSKLSIKFRGNCSDRDTEQKIISLVYNYALSHHIEELDTDNIASFQFGTPSSFEFRTLKTLRLRNGRLSNLQGFASLTVVELQQVRFLHSTPDDIFSNCLNLEKLVMDRCISCPAMLCISSPGLISLQIKDFYSKNGLEIKSPKLELCELDLIDHGNLRIDDCPALDNVNIHIGFVMRPFRYLKPEWPNPGFSTLNDVKNSQGGKQGFSTRRCDVKMVYCDYAMASNLVKICKGMCYARLLTMWLSSAGGSGSRILYNHDAAVANSSAVTVHLFAETLSAPDVRTRWGRCLPSLSSLSL